MDFGENWGFSCDFMGVEAYNYYIAITHALNVCDELSEITPKRETQRGGKAPDSKKSQFNDENTDSGEEYHLPTTKANSPRLRSLIELLDYVQVRGVQFDISPSYQQGTTRPPPPATLEALPTKRAPQGASSSTTAPAFALADPSRTTSTSRELSGTFIFTHENFTNIAARLEREERQHARLIDKLPTFVAIAIEKALHPLKDSLLVT
ncbi:hypothetical protein HAX54_004645 [Datura stramonium]|uniref:Uncharacterized protein n=1 Tax=Datura stramonium TaxID=4076 RepID=A0ABS8T8M6_DATST|nr:hypothetical protein [Datura stramonium]